MLSPETLDPRIGPATRYRPIAQIGRGGMAEVLLAVTESCGGARRLVVLKQIWPELAGDPEFMTMFTDEARLSLQLNHPNVVRTFELLHGESGLAIAMEYLDGQPLTRVLNRLRGRGDLGVPLRLRILINVLAGLEHAHTLAGLDGKPLGVVHRDVSPHNVFITYDGQVKLVDFGVAKTLAASHHTRPGALKGKLAYMAPEQFHGGELDRRADLFAVGIMLWELLAGRRMWHGKSEVQIVSHLATGLPFPKLPPDGGLPAGIDAVCARALEPDPARRYQTAAEMELDLEEVLAGAADSHARTLGKVISLAFANERAERQALIERGIQQPVEPAPSPAPALAPRPVLAPAPAPTPVDVAPSRDVAPAGAGARTLWPRRISLLAALLAVAGVVLHLGGLPRPLTATPSGSTEAAAARTPAAAPLGAQPGRPATTQRPSTAGADGVERVASRRPRHHHRDEAPPLDDEDATLPPTVDLNDEPTPSATSLARRDTDSETSR